MTSETSSLLLVPAHLSRWQRGRRKAVLRLADRVWSLTRQPTGGWRLDPDVPEVNAALQTPTLTLEQAITCVEQHIEIPNWTVERKETTSHWRSDPWLVIHSEDGARVYRTDMQQRATSQVFRNADRGRAWAESRFHRGTGSLFGRGFRSQKKSDVSLPVVRVTEEEKSKALGVAAQYGVTYAQFVRMAVDFFHSTPDAQARKEGDRMVFVLTPRRT
jgi:hypothetical protein